MSTIFSYIVQKRLSQENENVATEALAFVLQSSDAAKSGMIRFLSGLIPEPPELWFRTQQMEGDIRPDLWGLDEFTSPHVFIESKFWAGLTDNQPVAYLKKLAEQSHPTLLLVVVPDARQRTVWRELTKRLSEAEMETEPMQAPSGAKMVLAAKDGPRMALTTWDTLLSFLEAETGDDPMAHNNLEQLRSLCVAADCNAFFPFSREELSDQRFPSLVLQLSSLVKDVSDVAFEEQVLFRERLTPQADTERIGRYAYILSQEHCGVWLGIHFGLWREHGHTPFWLIFAISDFGRGPEVRNLLEPWASQSGVYVTAQPDGQTAVAIEIPSGEDKPIVVRSIVDQISHIGRVLESLPKRPPKEASDRSFEIPEG